MQPHPAMVALDRTLVECAVLLKNALSFSCLLGHSCSYRWEGKGQEDKEKWAKGAKMKDGSGEEEDWGHGGEESF